MQTNAPISTHTNVAAVLDLPMHLEFEARMNGRPLTHDELTLRYAWAYTSLGLYVLPLHGIDEEGCTCRGRSTGCRPGKHPWTSNGVHDATNDHDTITQMLSSRPGANLGVALERSGLWVLDLDDRFDHGYSGWHTLRDLEPVIGSALTGASLMVSSGNGLHGYFLTTGGTVGSNKLPGVDVLAGAVYAVLPPSRHMSGGGYTWIHRGDPTPAPPELITALRWLQPLPGVPTGHQSAGGASPMPAPGTGSAPALTAGGFQFLTQRGASTPYGKKVLSRAVRTLDQAKPGQIHVLVRTSALVCGSYVAGGEILETDAANQLHDAIDRIHQRYPSTDHRKALQVLFWGLREGRKSPKTAPPLEPEPWQAAILRNPALLLDEVPPSAPARDLHAVNVLTLATVVAGSEEIDLSLRDLAYNLGTSINTAGKARDALVSADLVRIAVPRRTQVVGKAAWASSRWDLSPLQERAMRELERDEHIGKGWGGVPMCSSRWVCRHDAYTGPRGHLRWLLLAAASIAPLDPSGLVAGQQSLRVVNMTVDELVASGHLRSAADGLLEATGADLDLLAATLETTGTVDRLARQFLREREAEAGYLRTGRSIPVSDPPEAPTEGQQGGTQCSPAA